MQKQAKVSGGRRSGIFYPREGQAGQGGEPWTERTSGELLQAIFQATNGRVKFSVTEALGAVCREELRYLICRRLVGRVAGEQLLEFNFEEILLAFVESVGVIRAAGLISNIET